MGRKRTPFLSASLTSNTTGKDQVESLARRVAGAPAGAEERSAPVAVHVEHQLDGEEHSKRNVEVFKGPRV